MAARPRLLTRAPAVESTVDRPRLQDVGDGPVVVLVGPPGSGTTVAAAQLAAADATRRSSTTAWCRLAPGYDTAADVVTMVADTVDPTAAFEPARRVIDLAEQLLGLLDGRAVTVVIDDAHLAADGDIDRMLAECAALLSSNCRIVVATATRPAGLLGLLTPGGCHVIDADDLAFTPDEARRLFELHGADADDAERWRGQLGGWTEGVVAGAHAPSADPSQHVASLLERLIAVDPGAPAIVDLAAAVDYATVDLLGRLGTALDEETLSEVVGATPLLTDHGGFVQLTDAAAQLHLRRSAPDAVADLRRRVGWELADDDPPTAIDALIDAGDHEAAADVLDDHLSEIGVERALTWLYRFPPDLRRRFPPVLAAGQATVEVDVALAAATARVEDAATERSRREALFALGSIEAHRGELAAAAAAYEAALRSARDDAAARTRVTEELAATRWLLGDMLGARSALAGLTVTSSTRWLRAQLDVVEGRTDPIGDEPDELDAFDHAALALRALARGDDATGHATQGYLAAVETGGEAFVAASVVRAWTLFLDADDEAALGVVEELERRAGPRHQLARVHGALVRERVSRRSGSRSDHERDERRRRDLRMRGYASIEQLAGAVLDRAATDSGGGGAGVQVCVIGDHVVHVGDRTIHRSDWTSKKALDVLTVLAAYGPTGARRDAVIEAVWPGREPDKGRTLLRTALSQIRRTLEPDRPAGEPSSHLTTREDVIVTSAELDLDHLERLLDDDPAAAFVQLSAGLAPSIVAAEWAQEWAPRVERLALRAAAEVPDSAERLQRIEALEALISAEPWQRRHYDRLIELHRHVGAESEAADVERRWFDDD